MNKLDSFQTNANRTTNLTTMITQRPPDTLSTSSGEKNEGHNHKQLFYRLIIYLLFRREKLSQEISARINFRERP